MRKDVIITFLALAGLSSCTEHDLSDSGRQGEPIMVQGEIVQQNVTRASDNGFADGDQIGVFIVDYVNGQPQPLKPTSNRANNVPFTYNNESGLWTGSQTIYWHDMQTAVDAYSYYPYDKDLSSVDAYPFTISKQQNNGSNYEQSDLLWAKAEGVAPGMPVRLKHHHLMAGIRVTLIEGSGFGAGEWATLQKTVLVQNVCTSSLINIETGRITVNGNEENSIVPYGAGDERRAVVVPQTVEAGQTLLTITVNGNNYYYERTEPTTLYSGRLHNFTISVNRREPSGEYEFTLISESITPWENDPVSHQCDVKEYLVVNMKNSQFLGDVLAEMGIEPENVINLKLTGEMNAKDNSYWDSYRSDTSEERPDTTSNFYYIRHHLSRLEALNLNELRLKKANVNQDDQPWWRKHLNNWEPIIYLDDYIPYRAFAGLHNLISIVYPDDLKGIGSEAFLKCGLNGSCILPEGLLYIGSSVFSPPDDDANSGEPRCHMTGDLYIPASCRYIGDYAFYMQDFNCELVLPEEMDYLGDCAFGGCKFMTGYLHIPEGLEELHFAWWGMDRLKGWAEVPQGITKIHGIGSPISSLHVPEGVREIASVIGYNYPNGEGYYSGYLAIRKELKEIHLPSTLNVLGNDCFAYTGITHVKLPDNITIIPEACFAKCENLQDTLYLPKNLATVRQHAFSDCTALQAVVIPENTTYIDEGAFKNCFSLDYIQCLGSTPPELSPSAFDGVAKDNFTVVVPEDAVETYRNAQGWKEFKRISAYRNFVCRPMQEKLLNKGHQYDMILNADGAWTVTYCPQWAHVSATSGYKKTALTITVDNLAHGAGTRRDSIVFTLNDQKDETGSPVTCYYKLTQYDYEYDEDSEVDLQRASRGNGKVSLFFCGDGYDAQDIAEGRYLDNIKQEMEYFFAVEPYKTYRDYFTVYTGIAMSHDSGIASLNYWRNTKFHSSFGNSTIDSRLTTDFAAALQYAVEVSPQLMTDAQTGALVIMVLNSDIYDGITMMGSDWSVAVCPMSGEAYPYDARGIIQHEAGGHGFGKLADEYISHLDFIQTCKCRCCGHLASLQADKAIGWARNLSLNGKYSTSEWRQLIFDPHYSDICDIYEGGYYHQRGVFRPEANSCMNNNIPYYNTPSRMAIVERIMQYAGESFNYDDFVAHDSRTMGDKFLTRGEAGLAVSNAGHGMHLHVPLVSKMSLKELLNRKKTNKR